MREKERERETQRMGRGGGGGGGGAREGGTSEVKKKKKKKKRGKMEQEEGHRTKLRKKKCLSVGCLTPQQHASLSQGRICEDKYTCCHTRKEVAYQTFNLTQSQYTYTGPTSPSTDPRTPGAWQGSHSGAKF